MTTAAPATVPPRATLLAASERLADIIEQENAALAAGDGDVVRRLLVEKRAAIAACEESARSFAAEATLPRFGLAHDRERRAAERLARAAAENHRRLAAAIGARKRLFEIIAGASRALDPSAGGYGRSGAAPDARRRSGAPAALSFDRAL